MFEGSRLAGGLMTLEQLGSLAGGVAGMPAWTSQQLDVALRSNHGGPVMRATVAAVQAGQLTVEEAEFNLMVMVGAGAETTTSLIGLAIAQLAERPALQADLRRDPAKVPAFIEEVLRWDSPFRYHPRTAARATRLGGKEIAEGALLLLLWASANRDGAVFDRPDDFVIGRANAHQHFGFGRGIHHCVGAALARLEAQIVVTRLLERTDSVALDASAKPQWSESIWIHRHDSLPILMDRRRP
jgi:cytochrome P450